MRASSCTSPSLHAHPDKRLRKHVLDAPFLLSLRKSAMVLWSGRNLSSNHHNSRFRAHSRSSRLRGADAVQMPVDVQHEQHRRIIARSARPGLSAPAPDIVPWMMSQYESMKAPLPLRKRSRRVPLLALYETSRSFRDGLTKRKSLKSNDFGDFLFFACSPLLNPLCF